MKLFQRFLAPKWKNKNPNIRKQALIALDRNDNQNIFSSIVQHDDVSDIRQLAAKRLNSVDELFSLSTKHSDANVRDIAQKLISQILAGSVDVHEKLVIDEKIRIEKITQLDQQQPENQKILEAIATKGDTAAVRTVAIVKIDREALLGDLTIKDSNREIRIQTAQRLQHKSTLERVLKVIKNKDKQISRIIKSKLEEITAEEQKPKLILAKQKSLCLSMEQLGNKGLWERDKTQFDQIKNQWTQLSSETETGLEHQTRFDAASHTFEEKYNNYLERNQERLDEEAALQPIKQEKQALLEQLKQLSTEINADSITEAKSQFSEVETKWRAIEKMPAELEQDFNSQFIDISKKIKASLRLIDATNKSEKGLNNLFTDINQLLKNSNKITKNSIDAIDKKLNAIKTDDTQQTDLKEKITQLVEKSKRMIEKNTAKSHQLMTTTEKLLSSVDASLSNGEIKLATDAQKKIQTNMKQLDKIAQPDEKQKLTDLKIQVSDFSARLAELNKWKSWASTPQQERLIAEIEALIDSDVSAKEIAFLVSKARKDWQKLGPSDQKNAQKMWARFNNACTSAYEPCKAVFDEESQIRSENFDKRVSFLSDLESFIANANWENINWTKVENLYQQSRTEWQNLGPVDKNKRKALNSRFTSAYVALKDQLTVEWARNEKIKQDIVDTAKSLIELEDLNAAINSAKGLQKQWSNAGRVQHFIEKKLWAAFRANCDAIFSRRDEEKKQQIQQHKDLASSKDALCAKLETLCNAPSKDIGHKRDEVNALRKEMSTLAAGDAKQDKLIKDRMSHALLIFELKQSASRRINQVESLLNLKSRIEFVQQIEENIEKSETVDWDSTAAKYEKLAPIPSPDWESVIDGRYKILQEKINSQNFSETASINLPTMQSSTIQLEIISEIDSPNDDASARLKIQTQRLNDRMNNHNEESQWDAFINTEIDWLLIGPLPSSQLQSFRDRHDAVIDKLKHQFPEELENY